MAITPLFVPQAIDGPPATPPVNGLFVAADVVDDGTEWYAGAAWRPEQIGGGGAVLLDCHGSTDQLDEGDNPVNQTAAPFVVWAEDHCSTLTGSKAIAEYEARARRQLLATQSYWAAREFQNGELRDNGPLPNFALVDARELVGPASDPWTAVGRVEAALGDIFRGRQCMIHVPIQVLEALQIAGGFLTRAGQKWLTPYGSIVVADAGYGSEDVEGTGTLFVYGTAKVQIRLGAIDIPSPVESLGSIDVTVNDVKLYAEREVLIQVDGSIGDTPGSGNADAMVKIATNIVPYSF